MKKLLPICLGMLCATGSTAAQPDLDRAIRVELILDSSYAAALGQAGTAEAISLGERALTDALGNAIRYFGFVPSDDQGDYTLQFHIRHPTPGSAASQRGANVRDYYVFLQLLEHGTPVVDSELHWLFRDAGSSLNGAETPPAIAASLALEVRQHQYQPIISELLSEVSFTDKAFFKHEGAPGWFIGRPRKILCMRPESVLAVYSTVPGEDFEHGFKAEVKRAAGDDDTTFCLAKDAVDLLMQEPSEAEVVAVKVLSYERDCAQPGDPAESTPEMVSF